ncbi:hypothetical protein HPB49_022920 [Dermacentor silvarum]|uniref:Uncharacterized protein n=1 Tax=Dermacentor silvarum TaxID=543639 RepID=A0ACB8CI11_DERSI|nr:hypothetical protein HPB49_022920 [Dermacentor silvarum]
METCDYGTEVAHWKELQQFAGLVTISSIKNDQARANAIAVLQREFPTGSGEYKVCSSCRDSLVAEKVPPMSVSYGYTYPPKPDHLPPLNPVEERLIAPRQPFMSIRRLTHGSGQYGIKGQVVNVPINVPNTVQCLPRNVPDDVAIDGHLKRRLVCKPSYKKGLVKKRNIHEWLKHLEHSPLYKYLKIRVDWSRLANVQDDVFEPGEQQFRAPGVNEARGPARRDIRGKVRMTVEPSVDEGIRGTRASAASARDGTSTEDVVDATASIVSLDEVYCVQHFSGRNHQVTVKSEPAMAKIVDADSLVIGEERVSIVPLSSHVTQPRLQRYPGSSSVAILQGDSDQPRPDGLASRRHHWNALRAHRDDTRHSCTQLPERGRPRSDLRLEGNAAGLPALCVSSGYFRMQCTAPFCARCGIYGHVGKGCVLPCRRCGDPHETAACSLRCTYSEAAYTLQSSTHAPDYPSNSPATLASTQEDLVQVPPAGTPAASPASPEPDDHEGVLPAETPCPVDIPGKPFVELSSSREPTEHNVPEAEVSPCLPVDSCQLVINATPGHEDDAASLCNESTTSSCASSPRIEELGDAAHGNETNLARLLTAHRVLHLIRRISSGPHQNCPFTRPNSSAASSCLFGSIPAPHGYRLGPSRMRQQGSDSRYYWSSTMHANPDTSGRGATNTIDELIHQRRQAKDLKPSFMQPAADLSAYMGSPVSTSPSSVDTLPPWDHQQLTDNKPIGRLRNPVPRPSATFRRHKEEADAALRTGSLMAYTDASCTDIQVVTSTVVQGRPSISANYVYRLTTPVASVSAELLAIRHATNFVTAASTSPAPVIIIRTDSTSAIKEIRKVYNAHPVADEIHRMTAQMHGQIQIQWIPRDTISAHIQADTATHMSDTRGVRQVARTREADSAALRATSRRFMRESASPEAISPAAFGLQG